MIRASALLCTRRTISGVPVTRGAFSSTEPPKSSAWRAATVSPSRSHLSDLCQINSTEHSAVRRSLGSAPGPTPSPRRARARAGDTLTSALAWATVRNDAPGVASVRLGLSEGGILPPPDAARPGLTPIALLAPETRRASGMLNRPDELSGAVVSDHVVCVNLKYGFVPPRPIRRGPCSGIAPSGPFEGSLSDLSDQALRRFLWVR